MYDPFEVGKTESRGTRGQIVVRLPPPVRGGSDIEPSVSRSQVSGASGARERVRSFAPRNRPIAARSSQAFFQQCHPENMSLKNGRKSRSDDRPSAARTRWRSREYPTKSTHHRKCRG